MPPATFLCGRFTLDTSRTRIMGIVNVTPDSFSDGGRYRNVDEAIDRARQLLAEGAELLDIGGESTRPGAPEVPDEIEIARVVPVIEALRDANVPLSVDTRKPTVMKAALDAGADILNDISGFEQSEARAVAAGRPNIGVIVMHMQGSPATMQEAPQYEDVGEEVTRYLLRQANLLRDLGLRQEQILLDPGLGFGKTTQHNLDLLRQTALLAERTGYGVLIGGSRKSMLGELTGQPVNQRLAASVALALAAAQRGAAIVRVHDVAATRDALTVWRAVEG